MGGSVPPRHGLTEHAADRTRSPMLRAAIISALLLGGIEGLSWWWMHPATASPDQSILVHQARSSTSNPPSPVPITPLPEIYAKSAPMLRCSGGQTFLATLDNDITVHCAFFEWDGTDTGSVLEAFRHMPEACMGSIGMQLVSKEKPRSYTVGRGGSPRPLVANGTKSQGIEEIKAQMPKVESQSEQAAKASAQSTSPTSSTDHSSSSSSPSSTARGSLLTDHSLLFDHTVFRDPTQAPLPGSLVHSFRAVWVAGRPNANPRAGIDGTSLENLRSIRLRSALHRDRPTHARVIQGAVRGALNAESAWNAFEQAMLSDLRFR